MKFVLFTCAVFLSAISGCNLPKASPLGQENAIWAESKYLRGYVPSTGEPVTDADVVKYADQLRRYKIKYVYLFAGPYGVDGHLPLYPFSSRALRTVKLLRSSYAEIVILPWIGGIQNKTVHLEDSVWVENALHDTERLVRFLNIPGVHVDFEFILPGDPFLDKDIDSPKPGDLERYGTNVNAFHKKLRARLPGAFISSVVTATAPDTRPWKRKTSLAELEVLARYVDQLSFLYYDTQIDDPSVFRRNASLLVSDITLLKKHPGGASAQYLVAIGTFINVPELQKYRDLEIESIPNTLQALRDAELAIGRPGDIVDGIAIFCDWQTTEDEYEAFFEHWARY